VSKITRDSYNVDIRTKVGAVLDDGPTYLSNVADDYTYGYGIALSLTSNVGQQKIDDSEWDSIRLDMIKARTHQKGTTWVATNLGLQNDIPGGANNSFDVTAGDDITTVIYNKYKSVADDIIADKWAVVVPEQASDSTPSAVSSRQTSLTFGGSAVWELSVAFSSPAAANRFFNAGGGVNINFSVVHTGSLSGEFRKQSEDMLANIQSMQGGANSYRFFGAQQWYTRNNTTYGTNAAEWYSDGGGGAYSSNLALLETRKDNAQAGDASILYIQLTLESQYTGGVASGSGAGAIGYGDSISLRITPNVTIRQSRNVVVTPGPSSYNYGNWSSS
jgi:hypothetical protein